ncbi:MAG: hypothetical protein A2271_02095 [Candidatus Moranbacteria bacterium RIFOXYA12_FULL_35_19]|nr:MAG: hypothetical protein UR78_C0022G0011 [Candidatus Moranbacteria bacterium GW2011_GWF2_35_39]OGI31795.1 MAG: hypothetical protein A2343_03470 [Candidatus Moranbacteria bacterium RIFOXYB12_FULL_35_8]OGI32094.1 MAG: hypothetical protein A2489_01655 [Candidatus Moranbacteria bacterium RIFOXYC12_FULL_36_13]OGI36754.1 MAG: hypothetical protein A2271_02095 [Candidatus Moranbacteria bacterium RIFOXYA12_FULL_35_19]
MNATEFLEEIRQFFAKNFPDFITIEPCDRTIRYAFYRNYNRQKLSIVILTPVKIENQELKFIPDSIMKIGTELRITKTKHTTIELIGTEIHVNSPWEKILKDKIETLIDLLKEIRQCDKCGNIMVPRTNQQKKTGTWFVSMHCRRCSTYKNVTFGIGLKNKLHKYLVRKKT